MVVRRPDRIRWSVAVAFAMCVTTIIITTVQRILYIYTRVLQYYIIQTTSGVALVTREAVAVAEAARLIAEHTRMRTTDKTNRRKDGI